MPGGEYGRMFSDARRFPLPCATLFVVLISVPGMAQTAAAPPVATETMVVVGTATPVPLTESQRPVELLPIKPMELAAETPIDYLRQDSSVFIEQRGADGAQADIVLRGGSFAQTLVLLNGFRINDAQAAHHNLDLPVSLEAMDSIQVLEGSGSTLHGVDALSGVVDFITAAPEHASLRLRLGEGGFESNEESLLGAAAHRNWSGRLTADRNFSTGFVYDRDYRNEDASAENWVGTRLGVTDLLFAASDRSFGADQFYGSYPSWERTKGWFASIRQDLGSKTAAGFGFRRHTDEFILFRGYPASSFCSANPADYHCYENNHIDGSWQSSLRHTVAVRKSSAVLIGLEADGDSIRSNALGVHARNRGAGYIDVDLRPAAKRWSLSAGAREEMFSGGARTVFSPDVAGSFRVANSLKVRGDVGYGYRVPTYTDLYYSDPETVGNASLKPESSWSFDGGADWTVSKRITLSGTGFYSRQHNTIDYVRANSSVKWQAVNLSGLRFNGAEAKLTWVPGKGQSVRIAWTALHGAHSALGGLQSEYVFNYPVQNIQATWTANLGRLIALTNMVQLAERYQQTVYPVWSATLTRDASRLRPYVRLTNLSNTGYQEITGVRMPGRSAMGGFVLQFGQ